MSSPNSSTWLRLTRLSVLPALTPQGRFPEVVLYDANPTDSHLRNAIPCAGIPYYHTVIVKNLPHGSKPELIMNTFRSRLPTAFKIDFLWSPDSDSGDSNIYVVCYDAATAFMLFKHLPNVDGYPARLTGEIYTPDGCPNWHAKVIKQWADVIFWAGFSGQEMVVGVGARGISKEGDQDLRWLAKHHVRYSPRGRDAKNEVTVFLGSIEKTFKPASENPNTYKVTQRFIDECKARMYRNRKEISLKLMFEDEDNAELFRRWLQEKASRGIPKGQRKLMPGRWYTYKY